MIQKKGLFAIFVLLSLVLTFSLVSFVSFTSAAINPANAEDPLGIGINPGDIPQTPQDAANVSLTYLQKEWTKIVAKNRYIGPVHNFFLEHQYVFIVLFNENYSFSLTFFGIVFMWVFVMILFGKAIDAFKLLKLGIPWIFGAFISIILAQLGFIKLIVTKELDFIFLSQYWWMRALVFTAIVIVLIILFYVDQVVSQAIEQSKKKKEEKDIKEGVEEVKQIKKGFDLK
jgi:hypothetical protein